MASTQQGFQRGRLMLAGGLAAVALSALPIESMAQSTGDGFMFRQPSGSWTFRGGYALANTSGEPYGVFRRETTTGPRSFDAFNLGADLNLALGRRFDFVATLDMSTRANTAEYREWEENGRPITHTTNLDRLAIGIGTRYNLVERGRRISALAFIPAKTVPYVGVTGGLLWYELQQEGDFVETTNQQTAAIYTDELRSGGYAMMGQAFAGIDRRLNARWSLIGETRYTHSSAELKSDYLGLGDIQLSGLAFNIGIGMRF